MNMYGAIVRPGGVMPNIKLRLLHGDGQAVTMLCMLCGMVDAS